MRPQITTAEEQTKRDEALWEAEAQRWLQEQEAKRAGPGAGRQPVAGTGPPAAERGGGRGGPPKLRYLARKPARDDFSLPEILAPSPAAAPASGSPPPPGTPTFPPLLLAIADGGGGDEPEPEPEPVCRPTKPYGVVTSITFVPVSRGGRGLSSQSRLAAYTLMVSCDDSDVLKGAHKIRVRGHTYMECRPTRWPLSPLIAIKSGDEVARWP